MSSSSSSSSSFSSSSSSSSSDTLQRYWLGGTGGSTTDWNVASNWAATSGGTPGAGIPTALTDVFFDTNSSGYDCIATAAMVCKSLTADANWNKNFSSGGNTLTSEGSVSFDHTGTLTLSSTTVTLNGDGDFHIGAVGTFTNGASLDLKGTGNIDIDKAHSSTPFLNITCAYNGKTTSMIGAQNCYFTGVFTTNSGGSLVLTTSILFFGSGTVTPYVWNGVQPSGTGEVFYQPQNTSTVTISAYKTQTVGSGISYYDKTGVTITYELAGNIEVSNFTFISNSGSNGTVILNTNNYTIDLYLGTSNFGITQTAGTNTSTFTANFGSSTIYIRGNSFVVQTDSGATCNLNLGTSVWYIRISWTNTAQTVVDAGTSTVNFTSVNTQGTGQPTITSAGNSFYNVVIHLTSNSYLFTLADAFSCNTLTHDSGAYGNFTSGGFNITAVSSINFDSTGTLTLSNSTITITGDGNFHIGVVGTIALSNCNLDLKGTGNLDIDKSLSTAIYFNNITCSYNTKTTTISGDSVVYYGGVFTLNSGGILTITSVANLGITWCGSGTITPFVQNTATVSSTNSSYLTFEPSTTSTISIGPFNFLSNIRLLLKDKTGVTVIYDMIGDVVLVTSAVTAPAIGITSNTNSSGVVIFSTNNYTIDIYGSITTTQTAGTTNTSSFTINLGSSTINLKALSLSAIDVGALLVLNMGTSNITMSGNAAWNISGCTTVDPGTSILGFTGTGGSLNVGTNAIYTLLGLTDLGAWALASNLICHDINFSDGVFDSGGFNITSSTSILIDGAGHSVTLTNSTITITGDGDFHIGSGVGTLSPSNCNLDLRGTGNLDIDKILTSATVFGNVTCGYSGKTTTIQGDSTFYFNGTLTSSLGGTVTFNVPTYIYWWGSGTITPYIQNGATWNGTGSYISCVPTGASTITLGEITLSGLALGFLFYDASGVTVTYNMAGHLTSVGYFLIRNNTNSSGTMIFNTNNYNITCTSSTRYFELAAILGANTGTITFNAGSSIITVGDNFQTSKDVGATINLNLQTSQLFIREGLDLSGCTTVDAGTSTVTFNDTGTTTIISAGFSLYNVVCNKSSAVNITLADALNCNTLTTLGSGNFNSGGFAINSISNILFDSTGTLTLTNSTVTIIGEGDFHIGSGVSTTTLSATILDLKGTGNFDIDKAKTRFHTLILAYSGKTTTITSFATYTGCNYYFTVGSGTLTIISNTFTTCYNANDVNCYNIDASATINGSGSWLLWINATGSVNIPAITATGTLTLNLQKQGGAALSTYNQTGHISAYAIVISGAVDTFVYNTNNYSLTTTGTFIQLGNNNASSTSTFNFGSSIINILELRPYTSGTTNINQENSTWNISGDLTYGTTWTLDAGTSTVNITNTSTITASSKGFATLVLNADTKTITWVDGNITINRLQVEPGTTVKFKEATTYTITTYTAGDWDGTVAKAVTLNSTTNDNQWNLNAPSGVSVSYVTVRDSNATFGTPIIAWNGTNTNSGNNLNWYFTSSSSSSSSSQSMSSSSSSSGVLSSSSSSSSVSDSFSSSSSSVSSSSSSSESSSFSSSSSSSSVSSSSSSSDSVSSSSSSSFSSSSSSSFSSSSSSSFSSSSSSSESFSSSSSSFSSSSYSFSSSSSSSGAITYRTSEASWRAITLDMPTTGDNATIYIINNYENFFRQPLSNGVYKTVSKRLLEDNLIDREDLIFWWRKEWQKNGNIVEEPVMGSHREVFDHLRDATYVVKNNL